MGKTTIITHVYMNKTKYSQHDNELGDGYYMLLNSVLDDTLKDTSIYSQLKNWYNKQINGGLVVSFEKHI
jgi:hypothetical protein